MTVVYRYSRYAGGTIYHEPSYWAVSPDYCPRPDCGGCDDCPAVDGPYPAWPDSWPPEEDTWAPREEPDMTPTITLTYYRAQVPATILTDADHDALLALLRRRVEQAMPQVRLVIHDEPGQGVTQIDVEDGDWDTYQDVVWGLLCLLHETRPWRVV